MAISIENNITLKSRLLSQWKAITAALVLIGIGSVFLYGGIANARDKYKLIRRGQIVQGFIIETWEDVEDSKSGRNIWYHGAIYTYQLPDGRELEGKLNGEGKLKPEFRSLSQPYPIEVTYLADNPAVSRITKELPDSTLRLLRDQIYPYGSNAYYDELMAKAAGEADAAERNRLMKEATLIFLKEVTNIPLSLEAEGNFWWPWMKNYYGEIYAEGGDRNGTLRYVWLDQDLKAEMGY